MESTRIFATSYLDLKAHRVGSKKRIYYFRSTRSAIGDVYEGREIRENAKTHFHAYHIE